MEQREVKDVRVCVCEKVRKQEKRIDREIEEEGLLERLKMRTRLVGRVRL